MSEIQDYRVAKRSILHPHPYTHTPVTLVLKRALTIVWRKTSYLFYG